MKSSIQRMLFILYLQRICWRMEMCSKVLHFNLAFSFSLFPSYLNLVTLHVFSGFQTQSLILSSIYHSATCSCVKVQLPFPSNRYFQEWDLIFCSRIFSQFKFSPTLIWPQPFISHSSSVFYSIASKKYKLLLLVIHFFEVWLKYKWLSYRLFKFCTYFSHFIWPLQIHRFPYAQCFYFYTQPQF